MHHGANQAAVEVDGIAAPLHSYSVGQLYEDIPHRTATGRLGPLPQLAPVRRLQNLGGTGVCDQGTFSYGDDGAPEATPSSRKGVE